MAVPNQTHVVHLFAAAAERVRMRIVELSLPSGSTVADLRRLLTQSSPALAEILERCAIAVDQEYAPDNATVIPPGAELAVLPPVSGG